MDVIVTPTEGGAVWQLTDLLGRSMGRITASAPRQFVIHPEGHASETMAGIRQGPHASLDAALAEIERHTRGVCRRNPGEDQLLDGAQQSSSSAEHRWLIEGEIFQAPHGRLPPAKFSNSPTQQKVTSSSAWGAGDRDIQTQPEVRGGINADSRDLGLRRPEDRAVQAQGLAYCGQPQPASRAAQP